MALSSGTVGAVSELLTCVDLLQRGFEVFRAVSPACSCDLAILKDGRLLRVEVRTGAVYEKQDGTVGHYLVRPDKEKSDILAIVDRQSGTITYEPAFEDVAAAA